MNINNVLKTFKNKISNGSRQFLVYNLTGPLKLNLLVEYPKSGGTWLGQLISSYLDIPFPRNRMPLLKRSLLHGHFLPVGRIKNAENIFFMIRDGRDVIVSMYYHFLVWNERNRLHPKDVLYYRKRIGFKDYENIRSNLPGFIEFVFTHRPSRLIRFRYEGNWHEFNERWMSFIDKNPDKIVVVRYESLLKNTPKELERVLKKSGIEKPDKKRIEEIVEKYSFVNQSKRGLGIENTKSFLRKGISGDWKNKFSKDAAEVFNRYAGKMLVKLGYEKDSSWVDLFHDKGESS